MQIPVAEIFGPTIAGEGIDAGRRTHFLRLGGCDMLPTGACSWCDSMHAVDPARVRELPKMSEQEILTAIEALGTSTRTLTITGGNPLLYDLTELVGAMRANNQWTIWVETQGTIYRDWLDMCNVTVSPKPPSAGVCDEDRLDAFIQNRLEAPTGWETVIKIPVDPAFEEGADLEFAAKIFKRYESAETLRDFHEARDLVENFCLSVVTYPGDTRDQIIERWEAVIDWAKDADIPDVRILAQLHAVIWGHKLGV